MFSGTKSKCQFIPGPLVEELLDFWAGVCPSTGPRFWLAVLCAVCDFPTSHRLWFSGIFSKKRLCVRKIFQGHDLERNKISLGLTKTAGMYAATLFFVCGGAVASWLVRSTLDRVVWV